MRGYMEYRNCLYGLRPFEKDTSSLHLKKLNKHFSLLSKKNTLQPVLHRIVEV